MTAVIINSNHALEILHLAYSSPLCLLVASKAALVVSLSFDYYWSSALLSIRRTSSPIPPQSKSPAPCQVALADPGLGV